MCEESPTHLGLRSSDLANRVRMFGADQYQYIYGIMKNIALGFGAFVLVRFLNDPQTLVPRLSFWLASVASIIVTHATAARGTLLIGMRYKWVDAVIPFSLGIVECLFFLILQPTTSFPSLWCYWYFIAAIHAALAVVIVWNRRCLTVGDDFAPELRPLISDFRGWLRNDIIGASAFSFSMIALGLAMNFSVLPRWPRMIWWQFVPALAIVCVYIGVIAEAEKQRLSIVRFIAQTP